MYPAVFGKESIQFREQQVLVIHASDSIYRHF